MTLKKTTIMLAATAALLFAVIPMASAQSLLDNSYYKDAKALLEKSQAAMDQGDYDGSAEMARQASALFAQSDAYVATMNQFYRANGWLSLANDRIAYARSIKADQNYKDAYSVAVKAAGRAKTALEAKEYDSSMSSSQEAIAALKDIAPKVAVAPPPPPPETPAAEPLPEYYTVRLTLPLRDCFWRIAGFPFVYNDPWKWKLLYDANKSLLQDPANPDLVAVGVRLVIPSLAGETRSGEYDPQKEYEPLPASQ